MSIRIGTGSSAVEPSEFRLGGLARPVSRVMVGIGDDAVPAYERAILPLQPMIVGSPTWTYLPDNAEYGKLAEFTVSGKGKGRFKVNVAAFSDTQTNNLRRKLELRYNAVTIASWTSYDNDQWTVTDSLSDEFDFPEDAKIEVWGELTNDYWENRHFRWWNVEVVPSVVQDPSALIPISLWGGRVRNPENPHVVFNERMRGSGWVDIAATADMGGAFSGGASSRYVRIRVNGTLMAFVRDSYIGRVTQEALVEEVYLEDNDLVTVDISNSSNMDMAMYGWTVDITTVRVEEPVDPAVETTTALTIDPSSVEEGEPVTLTATVTPSNAVGSVTFDGAGETSVVSLVNGVATTTRIFSAPGEYEVSAEFTPTSEEDFLPSSDTTSITVVEGAPQVVEITGTGYMESRNQLRDALTARGLDYATVETLPFALDTSQATNLEGLFSFCSELTEVPVMDTSNVTNMSSMYAFTPSLTEVPEMDTSNVRDMSYMFQGCSSLTEVPEMDTSNATHMGSMFQDCTALTSVPDMDTSNVAHMNSMFSNTKLTSVPEMDTSQVTNMSTMFAFNSSLVEVPEMDTSNVTNMGYMFAWCTALAYVPDMDTSNVTNMASMLAGTQSLTDGNVKLFGKHPDVDTTDMISNSGLTFEPFYTPAVETQTALAAVPTEITEGESISLTATVTPADAVGSVTFAVAGETSTVVVVNGTATGTLTVDMVGTHEVTADFIPDDDLDFMPSSDIASITVTAGPVILTGSGTEPRDQFRAALSSLGLSHGSIEAVPFPLDTSEATSLQGLFAACSTLTEVPEVDTSSVTNMSHMFNGCRKLTNIPDMDTSKVTNMSYMFAACSDLTEAPEMDTSNVTDMAYMFQACSSLTYIPDMDTSKVTNMRYTLMGTSALVDGNVRFLGKHPDVAAINVIQGSSLTRVPWYEVETTTTLTVVPDEIEEGESVTVTATVTPVEAVGVIDFDVAGQLSTVNVVNGEAVTTATLDEAGEFDITADFVPDSELDFLPSSATGSVKVVDGGPALEPMSWSGDGISSPPTTEIEVVKHTVTGSGWVRLDASMYGTGFSRHPQYGTDTAGTRYVAAYVNGERVLYKSAGSIGGNRVDGTADQVQLNEGDVLTFTVRSTGTFSRAISWWSFDLTPLEPAPPIDPENFESTGSITLAQGTNANLALDRWTELVDYTCPGRGYASLSFQGTVSGESPVTNNRYVRFLFNGEYVSPQGQATRAQTSISVNHTDVILSPGDRVQVVAMATSTTASDRALLSWNFDITPS